MGVFQHAIDAKGRTSLPARFRELLAAQNTDRLIVTQHLSDQCLVAYAPAQWGEVVAQVSKMPTFAEATKLVTRAFVAPAQECSVDKLGRILIPPSLREFASVGEEITWAGMGHRIEVWEPARWNDVQKKARDPQVQAELHKVLGTLPI